MKEINLKVNGMACAGCENRVKNILQNIDGIEKVEANHVTCEVKVVLNSEVSQEVIEQTINNLGYKIVKRK